MKMNFETRSWNYCYEEQSIWLGNTSTNLNIEGTNLGKVIKDLGYPLDSKLIYGGGHSEIDATGQPISSSIVMWGGIPCAWENVELYVNSPDINGDLIVNISDAVLFASDLIGNYNFRSDFNHDSVINYLDKEIFNSAIGASYP